LFNRDYLIPRLSQLVLLFLLLQSRLPTAQAQEISQQPSVQKSPQIVGGQPADPGEYPWQAMLLNDAGRFSCAGMLIQPKWVLTAGHCVANNRITDVVLGAHQRAEGDESSRQTIAIARIIHHAGYEDQTLENDIALIQLRQPASLNQNVGLIALITPTDRTLITAGTMAVVTGWGTTSEDGALAAELQEVTLPIVSQATCAKAYGDDLSDNLFCAGLSSGGKDSCQGDSGGPLIVPDGHSEQGWKVAGIVSSGNGCARVGYYGLYTKVINYHSWIIQQIAAFTVDLPPVEPTPTTSSTPTPSSSVDALINNGDFEAGNNGQWQQRSSQGYPLIVATLPLPALSGQFAAWLGGADNEVSRLIQPLSLPTADKIYLLFSYQLQSSEVECDRDRATLFLGDKRLMALALCNATATDGWQEVVLDMTRYAGSDQQLQFYTKTDQENPSSWLVENIYLTLTPGNREEGSILQPEDVEDTSAREENTPAEVATVVSASAIYLPIVQR